LRRAVAAAVSLAAFAFLAVQLHRNISELRLQDWSFEPFRLALSVVLLLVNLGLSAFVWKRILKSLGAELGFSQSFKILFVSSLGKYIPGKVWAYASQVYLSGKAGIPVGVCLTGAAIFFLAYTISGLAVFAVSLLFWPGFPVVAALAALIVCLAALTLLLSGSITGALLRLGARFSERFRNMSLDPSLTKRPSPAEIGRLFLLLGLAWIILMAALYFLVNSFYGIDATDSLVICGALVVSVILGVLSLIVPAGLGVREGVFSYLLSFFVPVSVAIVIALILRVWLTAGDALCFLIALRIKEPELS
jgi:uncharacterized membrane protein YbhN (UPF0104 family)